MSALSLADSSDFGILRLIVNDPDKAYQVLRDHAFVVKQSDVIAAVIDDRPGGLTAVLRILAEAKVSVEYMYAFVGNRQDGHAVVVMRTDNEEIAQQALDTHHISTLSPKISTVYNAATSSLAPARSLPWLRAGFSLCLTGAAVSSIISLDDIKRRYFREEANPCPKNQWSP